MGQAGGGIGALPGFGGTPFGQSSSMRAGMTDAFKGPGGQLTEFNPATMAETTKAPPPSTAPNFTAAGMDAGTGMPSYVTNWLQSGGQGTMPTSTGVMPASPVAQSEGGTLLKPESAPRLAQAANPKERITSAAATKAATTTAAAGKAAVADPMAGMTMIPFNAPGGYNQPGLQQPMAVSDQWNMGTGSSQQIASPPVGGGMNAPQMMGGPIFTDSKGGYFSKDAKTGKMVPLTGLALTTAKGMGKSMGYA